MIALTPEEVLIRLAAVEAEFMKTMTLELPDELAQKLELSFSQPSHPEHQLQNTRHITGFYIRADLHCHYPGHRTDNQTLEEPRGPSALLPGPADPSVM